MKARFEIDGAAYEVVPTRQPDGVRLGIAERTHLVSLRALGGGEAVVTVDGRAHRVWIAQRGDEVFVHAAGRAWRVLAVDALDAAHAHGAADDTVLAPMPGTVVAVHVRPGDTVHRGDALLAIESMKLETTLRATRDGVIASMPLEAGATFERDAVLATLEPQAD